MWGRAWKRYARRCAGAVVELVWRRAWKRYARRCAGAVDRAGVEERMEKVRSTLRWSCDFDSGEKRLGFAENSCL